MNKGMRPKVTGDTFFLPDPEGAVYFRNNHGSFRMEGSMIDRWIEQLVPMFNGEHTLEELTGGLPDAHRNRVFEIAAGLQQNGFVRDVSEDLPHSLPETIQAKFVSQIDFLDSFGGSGAARFERFRQSNVLAAGSGTMLVSLVSALLESGLPHIRMLFTDGKPADRERVAELAAYARLEDPEVRIEELAAPSGVVDWRQILAPYDFVLYVSQDGGWDDLRALHAACRDAGKPLLPAWICGRAGLAGPLVAPHAAGCWESALRRLHRCAVMDDEMREAPCSTAEALLANVMVFEWFKFAAGAGDSELCNQVYLLNLDTLEGKRHPFEPHPSVTHRGMVEWREMECAPDTGQSSDSQDLNALFPWLNGMTSPVTGLFHEWDEGDYRQLPLSVCRVRPADPLSAGPADLLPEIVCAGFTHEEARREAGLAGIEAYAARLAWPPDIGGIGAGETAAEGICRALRRFLTEELARRPWNGPGEELASDLFAVGDKRTAYYLRSLTTLAGQPFIGMGEALSGFPVVWVNAAEAWHGAVGFHLEMALQNALMRALMPLQCEFLEHTETRHSAAWAESDYGQVLSTACQILKRQGQRLIVREWGAEPFLKERLAGVYGVALREEGER